MRLERRNGCCLPIVEHGCCCDLKTCCKVQGWLAVIGSLSTMLLGFSYLFILSDVCNELAEWIRDNNGPNLTCFKDIDVNEGQDALEEDIFLARGYAAILLILATAWLVTAALFLRGINKEEPAKMVHFIRMMWMKLVLGCIAAFIVAVMFTPVALGSFLYLGFLLYCLICANSLRIHMESNCDLFSSTENLLQPPTPESFKVGF